MRNTTSNEPRPIWVMHLRVLGWRVACGHRHAARALPFKADEMSKGHTFGETIEGERCFKCNARYKKMVEIKAKKEAQAIAQGLRIPCLNYLKPL